MVADDVDLDAVEEVRSAPELVARLNLGIPRLRDNAVDTLLHARWVKSLVDDLQSQIDRATYERARPVDLLGDPLVTVRIAAVGSTKAQLERAIASALNGSYENVELLVCGDGPQPEAREAVASVEDRRVRYLEVSDRPRLPSQAIASRQVEGTAAINVLLREARGALIAPLDQDSAFTANHIRVLLQTLRSERADFAYGIAVSEWPNATWSLRGAWPLRQGAIAPPTVMYTRRLAHLGQDPDAWLWEESADWNLWRRIRDVGAPTSFTVATGCRTLPRAPTRPQALERSRGARRPRAGCRRHGGERAPRRRVAPARRGRARATPEGAPAAQAGPPRASPGRARLPVPAVALRLPLPRGGGAARAPAGHRVLLRPHEHRAVGAARVPAEPVRAPGEAPRHHRRVLRVPELRRQPARAAKSSGRAHLRRDPPGLRRRPGACRAQDPLPHEHVSGGRIVTGTDPELLRAVAARSATVFTNTAEAVAAVPEAIRVEGPMAVDFYEYRPRPRRDTFHMAFAADHRPRKGLDTTLQALAKLDDRFHLHVIGPHEPFVRGFPPDRLTFHGVLNPPSCGTCTGGATRSCRPCGRRARRHAGRDRPCRRLSDDHGLRGAGVRLRARLVQPAQRALDRRPDVHFLEFPVQDADALATAMRRLEADRDLRDALAERGAARIRERMNVRRVVDIKLAAMDLAPIQA